MHSLASRVLKEVGILTRGRPRQIFERRVMRNLNAPEEAGRIEKYKAKNNRVRLLKPDGDGDQAYLFDSFE